MTNKYIEKRAGIYQRYSHRTIPAMTRACVFFRALFWTLAVAVFIAFCPASSGADFNAPVFEKTLDNGLKVILLENHKAPVVTFQVWYRVGSRNEELGKTGITHLMEHMMFKGTKKLGPEQISRIIQEAGGNNNAFTSKDYTAYFETLSSDRIDVAIELEADRMANLALREEDFKTEKMVVMEERRLRTEDQPLAMLFEQANATAYMSHSYQWPVVGWMDDIAQLTVDDLRQYYKTYYIPNNAFLVAAGDLQPDALFSRIEKYFGSIPRGQTPPAVRSRVTSQLGERGVTVNRPARLPAFVFLYHVPNLTHPDSFALEVMAAVLSAGKSSRLYNALVRENPLALDVYADYPLISHDPGLFSFYAQLLPGKDVGQVQSAVERELEKVKSELVEEKELQKAKNQIESSFIFGQDSLFYQAMILARYEICGGWRQKDQYLQGIQKVNAQDILRVAGKYFVKENRTTGVLVPEKTERPVSPEETPLGHQTIMR